LSSPTYLDHLVISAMSLSLPDLLNLTYRSLRGNPLRSALTTVGVFMGVSAVTATLQVGSISRAVIAEQLAQRDAPQVTIMPQWQRGVGQRIRFRNDDLQYLQQRLEHWQAISALRWVGTTQTLFYDREATPIVMAVTQDFWQTSGKRLVSGRFFSTADYVNYHPVVVIDEFLAQQLFQNQSPVGQRLYAGRQPYTVVGVVATQFFDGEAPTGEMFVSMSFQQALEGSQDIGQLKIRPEHLAQMEQVQQQVEQLMQQRFPGEEFWVWNNVEDILEQQKTLQLTSRSLAAVGAISLLVGGVGIANIMIASVTERTSEIGLRRAIGATQQEIMLQLILEATILSLMGGIVAIATIHGVTVVVADTFALPYEFNVPIAMLALGSALGVGIGASLFPALRASQLDPVKALRSD
jgi:putative ABC transport system permease protein